MSQLARIFACIFAGVLPQVRHVGRFMATRGRVLHTFLCDVLVDGYEDALAKVPSDFREECKVIEFAKMPKAGEYAAEVAWAYNWKTDTARELGRNLERRYEGLVDESCEIAGTADVVGLTDDAVIVLDYKTGYADLGPAANSWQLKSYAVAAARAYKRSRAFVGFIRLGPAGVPWFNVADISAMELDAAAADMRLLLATVHEYRALQAKHEPIPAQYVEGPHCAQCSSVPYCAAKMRLVAQLAAAPQHLLAPGEVPVLSQRELATAYARLKLVKDLVERVEYAIKDRARVSPFPVEGREGYWYGPTERIGDDLDVDDTMLELERRFGDDVAKLAVKREVTKSSMEDAIKDSKWLTKAPGRKMAPTMRALVDGLREPYFLVSGPERPKPARFATREEADARDIAHGSDVVREVRASKRVTTFPVLEHKPKTPPDVASALEADTSTAPPFALIEGGKVDAPAVVVETSDEPQGAA